MLKGVPIQTTTCRVTLPVTHATLELMSTIYSLSCLASRLFLAVSTTPFSKYFQFVGSKFLTTRTISLSGAFFLYLHLLGLHIMPNPLPNQFHLVQGEAIQESINYSHFLKCKTCHVYNFSRPGPRCFNKPKCLLSISLIKCTIQTNGK